ncbi:acetate--CoA ligase family protein [Maridesulfovibrio hydrothermalis]|uniref:CoA-binding domain protein n=1 Tax=Maridesulfovibrio hydrothermalis AM13 = DSM 14728 TaxID=1121451 RepID=L0RBL2_9BACT|nr:acetate--CoA ligase [Maridesulfovibrio hydrothermalis]CCO23570.1 CoA-binding domain protein [Maridesulfovibrio hydrothermalis AM13 = DSM 14728]
MDSLFAPSSIAVIGASSVPDKIGNTILTNIISAGYKGRIYAVNPRGGNICGIDAFKNISEMGRSVDLAIIAIPRDAVVESFRELLETGVKSVIVITAGFKEVDQDGWLLEVELARLAESNGVNLLGPNCLGLINSASGVNASFATGNPLPGSTAFFSQSGALCVAVLDWAIGVGLGFSKFISLGNKAVLDEASMLEYLGNDPDTKVILGYVENVEDGRNFMKQAARVSMKKPVIMMKAGTTAAGARAASSHTGAIAGSDQACDAAFKQSGVIRVERLDELFNLAKAFSLQELPLGPNLGIVTNAGGPGILAADACGESGMRMPTFSPSTIGDLQRMLPGYASVYNPVDLLGDADADSYGRAVRIVGHDPVVNSMLIIIAPSSRLDLKGVAQAVVSAVAEVKKPVFCCLMGRKDSEEAREIFASAGVPVYDFPKQAVRAMDSMHRYAVWKGRPPRTYRTPQYDMDGAREVIDAALRSGRSDLVEFQVRDIVTAYGLPTPESDLARSGDEAVKIAEQLGFPVVLKIASPDISHKSDVDGVRVGLNTAAEVKAAFWEITAQTQRLRPDAYIAGCLVQQMASPGSREVVIGFRRDDQFGPLLMFGLGGVYVEILKDISFRLAPLSVEEAGDMVREIRSYMLLKGVKGGEPVDLEAITDVLIRMSCLADDFPEIYEAEFNPVLVSSDEALVADARLTVVELPESIRGAGPGTEDELE